MKKYNGFFAYPAAPKEIGDVIEAAAEKALWGGNEVSFKTWKALDICGYFIADQVTEALDVSDFNIADAELIATVNASENVYHDRNVVE